MREISQPSQHQIRSPVVPPALGFTSQVDNYEQKQPPLSSDPTLPIPFGHSLSSDFNVTSASGTVSQSAPDSIVSGPPDSTNDQSGAPFANGGLRRRILRDPEDTSEACLRCRMSRVKVGGYISLSRSYLLTI